MPDDLLRRLEAPPDPTTARDLAHACEDAGRPRLAVTAWRRVLDLFPGDTEALDALAALEADLGTSRAEAEAPEAEPRPDDGEGPSEADLVRFAGLFAGREDRHAVMWRRGRQTGYGPVPGGLTADVARAHVTGASTVGSYALRADHAVRWACVDLDLSRAARTQALGDAQAGRVAWDALVASAGVLAEALEACDLDPLLERSGGKGMHVWVFFATFTPARSVRSFLTALLGRLGAPPPAVTVEVFPKQNRLEPGGLGNLVKLPLGRHLGSGRWSRLTDCAGSPLKDPWARLRRLQPGEVPAVLPPSLPAWTTPPDDPGPTAIPEPVRHGDRPFTEGDLDADPELGPVVRGCAVVRTVLEDALAHGTLSRDRSIVLQHTLGHLRTGVAAVNYVHQRVDPGSSPPLGATLGGSPASCKRIRQRLRDVADRVGCACQLTPTPGGYPHPLLHREAHPRAPEALEADLEALAALELRHRRVTGERDALRARVGAALTTLPDRACAVPGGRWRLTDHDGAPTLVFEPATSGSEGEE